MNCFNIFWLFLLLFFDTVTGLGQSDPLEDSANEGSEANALMIHNDESASQNLIAVLGNLACLPSELLIIIIGYLPEVDEISLSGVNAYLWRFVKHLRNPNDLFHYALKFFINLIDRNAMMNSLNHQLFGHDKKDFYNFSQNLFKAGYWNAFLMYAYFLKQLNVSLKGGIDYLNYAVNMGDFEALVFLLQLGIHPSPCQLNECMPLHLAVYYNQMPMVRLLLGRGADVRVRAKKWYFINERSKFHPTPLDLAVRGQDTAMVELLINHLTQNKIVVAKSVIFRVLNYLHEQWLRCPKNISHQETLSTMVGLLLAYVDLHRWAYDRRFLK